MDSHGTGMPLWAGKDDIKEYLKLVNRNGKALEYCMFQPGLFLNYLATPHRTAEYLTQLNTFADLENRRAIVIDELDPVVSMTTVQDMAAVLARAVDFEGEWPEVGGIQGNNLAISEIVDVGKRLRAFRHHSVSEEEADKMFETVLVGILLGCAKGAWEVSDEWNKLLPDFKFTKVVDFVADVWSGKL
ncbi:hypothetical protein CMQ_6599 [Grosmannia clavigera kw1407]|uniref:Uncharacterized protein n=1 Tax=Grosmannia clavigera (strain kw1407 / UAMH 11150) TaxID=655863 RepID=F0X735_GROCL|nr:uncharacterized protein CMQ_6599 [Grosmannia clavigera kw1407]EFX06278.1 hypothetical protein CMQ_6599 [Grosmannia clavigera kw1407]